MKQTKKTKLIILFSLLFVFIIYLIINFWYSNYSFKTIYYSIKSSKIVNPIKIVQLSDLHSKEYGTENGDIIKEIERINPDIIITTGDMIDGFGSKSEVLCNLLAELSEIAPLYSSLGNHELMYDEEAALKTTEIYQKSGAILLDKDFIDVTVNGNEIRIGGIYGYCLPDIYFENNKEHQENSDFVRNFQSTENLSILLCHMPVCFILNQGLDYWDVDLVFSGHLHAGQVRIPFLGGVIAPDMGWFPGEVRGIYSSNNGEKSLVLSGGLGSSENIPRFNNVPELIVTNVLPE